MLFFMDNIRDCVKGDESEGGIGVLFGVCLSCWLTWSEMEVKCSLSCYGSIIRN